MQCKDSRVTLGSVDRCQHAGVWWAGVAAAPAPDARKAAPVSTACLPRLQPTARNQLAVQKNGRGGRRGQCKRRAGQPGRPGRRERVAGAQGSSREGSRDGSRER